jgi:hypothetical protein
MNSTIRRILMGKDAEERRDMLEAEEDATDTIDAALLGRVVKGSGSGGGPLAEIAGVRAITSPELYRDLEVHRSYDGTALGSTLMGAVDHTRLQGGREFLAALLDCPTDDVELLRKRQACLKTLERAADASGVALKLHDMATVESDVLWMFRYREDESLRTLYDISFFRMWFLRGFNTSSWALTGMNMHRIFVSPLIGLLSPIVYFVVPYLVVRFKFGLKLSFGTYLWLLYKSMVAANDMVKLPSSMRWAKYASYLFSMVFYFQSVFTSFEVSSTLRKVCRSLSTRVSRVTRFFDKAVEVRSAVWSDDIATKWFPRLPLNPSAPPIPPGEHPPRFGVLLGNFGSELKAFRTFDHAAAAAVLRSVYAIDALLSIPRARAELGATWADYVEPSDGQGPVLELEGMKHPGLRPEVAVPNTWILGAGGARHALLTGPNAGGKSTLLKGVLLSVLMSQTLTIAPCTTSCRLTPFHFISSHINVPDSQGRESLFEAEMHRSKRNLDALKALAPGQRALVVMDEIFSSTNPLEGIAGAFAVAKSMAAHPGALCIISTHYLYLCKLERDTNLAFRNFRMPVQLQLHGGDSRVVAHPYRVRRGVSRQYVALELLRQSGFGDEILDEAITIKRRLLGKEEKTEKVKEKDKSEKVEEEEQAEKAEEEEKSEKVKEEEKSEKAEEEEQAEKAEEEGG